MTNGAIKDVDPTASPKKECQSLGSSYDTDLAVESLDSAYVILSNHDTSVAEVRSRVGWITSQVSGESILEIGSSNGIIPILLGRKGLRVVSSAIDPEVTERARVLLDEEMNAVRERIEFLDVRSLQDSSDLLFDTVILGEATAESSCFADLIQTAMRYLANGGTLVFAVPFGLVPVKDRQRSLWLSDMKRLIAHHGTVEHLSIVDNYIRATVRKVVKADDPLREENLLSLTEQAVSQSQAMLWSQTAENASIIEQFKHKLSLAQQEVAWAKASLAEKDAELSATQADLAAAQNAFSAIEHPLTITSKETAAAEQSGHPKFDIVTDHETLWSKALVGLFENLDLRPADVATAATKLAKSRFTEDRMSTLVLASLAYMLDPRPFRQKWYGFALFKSGLLREAEYILDGLLGKIQFSSSETRAYESLKGRSELGGGATRELVAPKVELKRITPVLANGHYIAARCLEDKSTVLTLAEQDFMLTNALSIDLDDDALLAVAQTLSSMGRIGALEPIVTELQQRFREATGTASESVQRLVGYQKLFREGVPVPSRSSRRINPRDRVALSFLHAVPPYHTSGYAIRSHAIARAAMTHGSWTLRSHTRIGYPWDVRGTATPSDPRQTPFDGIQYLHEKGSVGSRGDLHEYIARAAVYAERAIFRERPALVHAASNYINALPALIGARRAGIPFVYEVRGLWELTHAAGNEWWLETDRFALDKHIETVIAREADGVIAITNGVRQELIARGVAPERIILAPNCIDVDEFVETPRDLALTEKLAIDPDVPTIGYIGSFVEYEGLDLLLEAIARMRAEGLRFNVLMVGDGRDMAAFRNKLIELGLSDFVKVTGRVPFADVPRYYSLIDITPFPRLPYKVCELVSPLKPLEALALGKLVIGSSVGGIREIIEHDVNGLIVQAGDADSLYAALRLAVVKLDSFQGLRKKGRDWVRANRRWSNNVIAMNEMFERLAPTSGIPRTSQAVGGGTVVSVTIPDVKPTTSVVAEFICADGTSKGVSEPVLPAQFHKGSLVNIIAPNQAVALNAIRRSDGGPQPIATICDRPVPLIVEPRTLYKRLDRVVTLTHEDPVIFSAQVSAETHYEVEFDIAAFGSPDVEVVVSMRFLDSLSGSSNAEDDMQPSGGSTSYPIQAKKGPQRVKFDTPANVTAVQVAFRVGAGSQGGSIQVKPRVLLHKVSSEENEAATFDLRDTLNWTHGGPEPVELTSDALTASAAVQPETPYAIIPNIILSGDSAKELQQIALVTIDFGDNKNGDYAKYSGLRYSDKLNLYYEYVRGAQPNAAVRFKTAPQAKSINVGLRIWKSGGYSVLASPLLTIQSEPKNTQVIEYNIDNQQTNVLLFADLNLNLIDGSAVWLMSVAEALSRLPQTTVYVLSRNPLHERPFLQRLRQIPNCRILDPEAHLTLGGPIASKDAAMVITRLDAQVGGFDYIVARGFRVNLDLALEPRLKGRLCPYLTDIPQQVEEMTSEARDALDAIFRRSHQVLLQSEWLIDFVTSQFPQHAAKISMLPPMIPDVTHPQTMMAGGIGAARLMCTESRDQRIVYAGKMAPEWGILELFSAFDALRAELPSLELHVIGSKIHNPSDLPDFARQVRERLQSGRGIVWHKELPRDEILRALPTFSVGWAWREPAFERANRELSTKLLEYGAAGLPAVLTRTDRYEQLLGKDYPLFADDSAQAVDALRRALSNYRTRQTASQALSAAARPHKLGVTAAERLAPVIRPRSRHKGIVVIAGHDLKFAGSIESGLIHRGWRVYRDVWKGHDSHDVAESRRLLARADVVFCEWALGNLTWYSNNVSDGQRLISRLHLQELQTEHMNRVEWSKVDKLLFVSETYRIEGIERFGIPPDRTLLVPNLIDCDWFDGERDDEARFNLGIVGVVPQRKRLDRALNVLERLRQIDSRYHLYIKGKQPSDYPWIRNRPDEMTYFQEQMDRIRNNAVLRDGVTFSDFDPNLSSWYRGIGYMLSTSDFESFHMSVAESAAGGTIPVIFPWSAAHDIYPDKWIVADETDAVRRIHNMNSLSAQVRALHRREARKFIRVGFDSEIIATQIENLIS